MFTVRYVPALSYLTLLGLSIFVGVGTGYVKVMDDGSGIALDGLVLLGERYATSKLAYLADMNAATRCFGFRGELLGSISDVSLLEIVTRAHGRPNGYRKVLKWLAVLLGMQVFVSWN